MVFIGKRDGVLMLPLMTPSHRGSIPWGQRTQGARGACCQLVVVQPPAATGLMPGHCPRGGSPHSALSSRS